MASCLSGERRARVVVSLCEGKGADRPGLPIFRNSSPLDPDDDIRRWELVYISLVVTNFTNQDDQCGLVGVVGYHVRLTRERSPVRTWHETTFFFSAYGP